MLPGAVMGLDVQALLDRAERMAHSCAHSVPAADNPGLVLGSIIGVCARRGGTSSRSWRRPRSQTSAPGSSSFWPNRPARTAGA